MDKLNTLLTSATPFIAAVTALLVVILNWRVHRIQKQTDGMSKALQEQAEERGRRDESDAAKEGNTVVGTPPTSTHTV